jgi:hypothetical protein
MSISIYVEGPADKKFISDVIKHLNPQIKIDEIIAIDGYTNLFKFENNISLRNDFGGRNFIVFDADENISDKIYEIKRINNKLNCKIEYFFFPDNSDTGDLEDLLIKIINPEHKVVLDCFENYQNCLSKNNNYTLPNKKALIYAYCEALLSKKDSKYIKESNRDYLNEKLWNINATALNPLKEFLKEIFIKN